MPGCARLRALGLILLTVAAGVGRLGAEAALADRVVIVAAGDSPDSMAIARHYAAVRQVPAANIIELRPSAAETITWKEFVATIWNPLEDALVHRGWIDALPMELQDEVGRRQFAVSGHRIAALVVCRGIPLRIADDPALFREVPPLTSHPEMRTNAAAVDSELSLLARNDSPINATVSNPLYRNDRPDEAVRAQVVKVARLDGPSAEDALHLVDLAVRAERDGLLGRAYVDLAGPHESGNRWLAAAAATAAVLGFDVSVTGGPATMPASTRIDSPVIYLGWYTPDLDGPFALPGFRFPPGAVAEHIHSFSARTLHSTTEGWCGPLLARGVTATVGNVYEPYLEFVHHPDLLMRALARGDNLVDAAYYALPVLSWQSIVVGDPLYRPFKRPWAEQWRERASLPVATAGYAAIRQMHLLDAQGQGPAALAVGLAAVQAAPNLALALEVAGRLAAAGHRDEAARTVRDAAVSAGAAVGNWELLRAAAAFLAQNRRYAEATELYQRLFAIDALPPGVRAAWLPEARVAALAAGQSAQAADWKQEQQALAEPGLRPAAMP